MEKQILSNKMHQIAIAAIIVVTIVLLIILFSSDPMRITNEIEKPSFTIRLPKPFYEDDEGDFINGGDDFLYVAFNYVDNDIMLNTEGFALLCESSYFNADEIYSREKLDINGTEAWQMEYLTLSLGTDEIQNYYAGVVTIFPLNNEFLIVDAYEYLGEENTEISLISDKNMKLLKDITSTVQITNAGYNNTGSNAEWLNAAKLKIKLTSDWSLEEEVAYGFFDYGYFVSYKYRKFKMWLNIYEYNDENAVDLHEVLETRTKNSTYTSMGEGFIAGERALFFSYNAFSESGGPPYLYGAVAVSEHYAVDMHFYLYTDEYTLPYDTARKMLNTILEVEYK